MRLRLLWLRLRTLWVQNVHGRSGNFDSFNDPVFVKLCPRCLSPPGSCNCDN